MTKFYKELLQITNKGALTQKDKLTVFFCAALPVSFMRRRGRIQIEQITGKGALTRNDKKRTFLSVRHSLA